MYGGKEQFQVSIRLSFCVDLNFVSRVLTIEPIAL
jgi:hypothetical protein